MCWQTPSRLASTSLFQNRKIRNSCFSKYASRCLSGSLSECCAPSTSMISFSSKQIKSTMYPSIGTCRLNFMPSSFFPRSACQSIFSARVESARMDFANSRFLSGVRRCGMARKAPLLQKLSTWLAPSTSFCFLSRRGRDKWRTTSLQISQLRQNHFCHRIMQFLLFGRFFLRGDFRADDRAARGWDGKMPRRILREGAEWVPRSVVRTKRQIFKANHTPLKPIARHMSMPAFAT